MTLRYHGNWCGPGWSAGKYKNAKDLTEQDMQVDAIDSLDELCKAHDIAIRYAKTRSDYKKANDLFIKGASALGWKGYLAAKAVGLFGPEKDDTIADYQHKFDRIAEGPVKKGSSRAKEMSTFATSVLGKSFFILRDETKDTRKTCNWLHMAQRRTRH